MSERERYFAVKDQSRPVGAASSAALPRGFHSRLLQGLTPSEIGAVLALAKQQRISPNEVLRNEGDTAIHLSLMVRGFAAFYKITADGRKLFLRWIAPGDAFGLAALLQIQQPYLMSVHAMSEGRLFAWDRMSAQALASQIPRLRENAYTIVGDYLASLIDALAARASLNAQQRIARVLVESARQTGRAGSRDIELALTNEQVAQMADVTLFTVSRQLNKWQSQGILKKGRRKILLRAPNRLGSQY
jgi:CRP/FNR family transcriptional regulator, nitrogen oxide reductase regulator